MTLTINEAVTLPLTRLTADEKAETLSYTNINGKLVPSESAAISPDNSAFRYGAGLFETMLVQRGAIRLLQYHWHRLFSGLQRLDFDIPVLMTPAFLEEEVLRTVAKNKLEELCRVRLQLYAGSGGMFGPASKAPLFVIECYALDADTLSLNENGLVTGLAEGVSKSNDSLANFKTSNALVYAMAARQAKQHRWNDALVCNNAGNIIESTIANIFLIKNGTVFTPPLSEGCVAGVMRRHIMTTVKTVVEQPFTKELLADADEVFLSNAVRGVKWVREFERTQYNNTMTRTLAATLYL